MNILLGTHLADNSNLCTLLTSPNLRTNSMQHVYRLQNCGLNSRFLGSGLSFTDYITQTRTMLARVHTDADAQARIEGNAPFELRPQVRDGLSKTYHRGIVLTHGASDSPYHMQHLARFFQAQGWRVMGVLLPGHGTVPGDLLDMHWQEWASTVAYAADRLAVEVDELYLGGFSAGGTLSVRQSVRDERVLGLFLFAPALKISFRAKFANLHKLYSWVSPNAKWVDILPDRDLYKYESFSKNAAAQTYALIADTQAHLRRHTLTIPIFAAASLEDATVDAKTTFRFIVGAQHPASKLLLYAANPATVFKSPRVDTINSVMLERRILSSAHTAIVIAPEDPHYGITGHYANCLHYFMNDHASYVTCCNQPDEVWQGELTRQNLKAGILRRLMYNPHFTSLQESMQQFIANM